MDGQGVGTIVDDDTLAAELSVDKLDLLAVDADADGLPSPGDTLRYEISVANPGGSAVIGVTLHDLIPAHTALVPGSVTTSQGTVTTGNTAGDTGVFVDAGLLIAGGTQVTDESARACGMDAGFGRGTKGRDVASFIVN